MLLAPGFELLPGYVLVRHLGSGCIGDVWETSGPGGTSAALKIVRLAGASGVKEFRAIQRVKHLRHPNLNPITACWLLDAEGRTLAVRSVGRGQLDVDGSANVLVIGMILGSMSLQTRLSHCKAQNLPGIPSDELLGYMEAAAKGIDYLNQSDHGLGEDDPGPIQHGDIKPLNLLLVGDSVQVCDFGLARALEDQRRSLDRLAGTPAYMAPEICSGESPSRTTDQYSLAITYYELRTGELPLHDDDMTSVTRVADAHRQNRLDFSQVSEPERLILQQATRLQPSQRFASTRDFVAKLRRAVEASEDGEGPPPALGGQSWLEGGSRDVSLGDLHSTRLQNDRNGASDTVSEERIPTGPHQTLFDAGRTIRETAPEKGDRRRASKDTVVGGPARVIQKTAAAVIAETSVEEDPHSKKKPPDPPSRWKLAAGAVVLVLAGLAVWRLNPTPEPDIDHNGVVPVVPTDEEKWTLALAAFHQGEIVEALQLRPAIGSLDETLASCVVRRWQAHDDTIYSMTLSTDNKTLLTADWSGGLRSWSWPPGDTPQAINLQGDGDPAMLSFSSDQRWIIGASQGGRMSLWRRSSLASTADAKMLFPPSDPSRPETVIIATAANAHWLVAANDDKNLALWSLQEVSDQAPAETPPRAVFVTEALLAGMVPFDGGFLTFDENGRIQRWDCDDEVVGSLQPQTIFSGQSPGVSLNTRDRWLIAGDEQGAVRWWPVETAADATRRELLLDGNSLPANGLRTTSVDLWRQVGANQRWILRVTARNQLTIANESGAVQPLEISKNDFETFASNGRTNFQIQSILCTDAGELLLGLNNGEVISLALDRLIVARAPN